MTTHTMITDPAYENGYDSEFGMCELSEKHHDWANLNM